MPEAVPLVLRDGTRLTLRTMQASDADALVRFHRALSRETTRARFFVEHPELTPAEVRHFTHVDHVDREAVVAADGDEIVGIARFDRLDQPTEAEIAFVVRDGWTGRGVGTALLEQLVVLARSAGVGRLRAETLAGNGRMVRLLAASGLPHTVRSRGSVLEISVDLSG